MHTLKLMIADSSEDFCQSVTKQLSDRFVIKTCGDGIHALELLKLFAPDIFVVDMMLPGLDGITLLQRASLQKASPIIIATTGYFSGYITDAAERMGISYIIRKPCCAEACAERILDISRQLSAAGPDPDPRTRVSNLLLQMGFSTKLKGYGFLREAILLFSLDTDQLVTKELYPAVAEMFLSTGVRVERAIRSAIKDAWQSSSSEMWQYFFAGDDTPAACPTNSEFINRLTDYLLLEKELPAKA